MFEKRKSFFALLMPPQIGTDAGPASKPPVRRGGIGSPSFGTHGSSSPHQFLAYEFKSP